jgi:hypothetical protein
MAAQAVQRVGQQPRDVHLGQPDERGDLGLGVRRAKTSIPSPE